MPTTRVVLYDSFSYLLGMIKRGTFPGDSPNHLYYFGCTGTFEGVMSTVQVCQFPENRLAEVLEMLTRAEREGRVSWRTAGGMHEGTERIRFQTMLQKAREMGAMIPAWELYSRHSDAYWNIPAMREFLGDSVDYANRI